MSTSSRTGELPPPPPRAFFGRSELIERIIGFAERLTPIALIGAGGIGKTSAALAVLYDDRIKRRFGEHRRFIRCEEFPASLPHLLRRLSKVIGAGIEDPEALTVLRPYLSSKDMYIVLDNAESILDPRGASAEEIYDVVEELSQLSNICLCITSRISIFPSNCKRLDTPTLPMEAACDIFYRIYQHDERSDLVSNILKQLDFHPLSITLLATVAHQNEWDIDRLFSEWNERRTGMLRTEHNKSLAATIELSLESLTFQELGPDARDLLGVIAFFPQGVDRNNADWLFPTIANRKNMFDKFCVLSLTYRSGDFITMLAPFRDYLSPKDPMSAPLLCSTKDRYLCRLLVDIEPGRLGFKEAGWIVSEDVNAEHLLDVFTAIDGGSGGVWDACAGFMKHLYWHKPRVVTLGPKVESLPDNHPSKPQYLLHLSWLFRAVGNNAENKRLLTHCLKLSRERGDDRQLIRTLRNLSHVNFVIGLRVEGMQQAKEASETSKRFGDTIEQVRCLINLAWLLNEDKRFNAAEEAVSHAISLLQGKDEQPLVCDCHRVLGEIYSRRGNTEKAIHHLKIALGIASPSNWHSSLSRVHLSMANLFSNEGRFGDAHTHFEYAKSHAVNNHDTYILTHVMWVQAKSWRRQHRFEEAKSEALRAVEIFQELGASNDAQGVGELLSLIDRDAQRKGNERSCHIQ